MENTMKSSILDMAMGAIKERVDYDVMKVVDNILDVNTKSKAKRKITLTMEFVPDEDRQKIGISVTSKASLCPTNPVSTALAFVPNSDGEALLVEMVPQVPGQMSLEGPEQPAPKLLKLSATRQAQ